MKFGLLNVGITIEANTKFGTPDGKNVAEGLTKIISCVTKEPRKSPETDIQCLGKLNGKT
jgi:hypothetical protein